MKRRRGEDDAKTHPHARALEPRGGEGSADAIFRSFVQRASGVPEVPADTPTLSDQTPADGIDLDAERDEHDRGLDDVRDPPEAARDAHDEDEEEEEEDPDSLRLGDATDPRIPARWAETVEMLLEQGRQETRRVDVASLPRHTPVEGVMLLTSRKSAPPGTPAATDTQEDEHEEAEPASEPTRVRPSGEHSLPDSVPTLLHSSEEAALPAAVATRLRQLDDDEPRTVSVQAARFAERLRAERTATATPSSPIELTAPKAKVPSAPPPPRAAFRSEPPPPREGSQVKREEEWQSVVSAPSTTTQRREALRLVPDVAQVAVAPPPPSEKSEDGLVPSGLLDRKLTDMAVLLRYGHDAQVQRELEHVRSRYPQDLLLARRIAEFYLSNERPALALEQLFSLATGLFERRNVEGMRQALEQVLIIDPKNERAVRLLGLLEQRPADVPAPPAGRKQR